MFIVKIEASYDKLKQIIDVHIHSIMVQLCVKYL